MKPKLIAFTLLSSLSLTAFAYDYEPTLLGGI